MRSSLDTLMDIMLTVMVFAMGLSIFILMFNSMFYNINYGFGTLRDKSVMSTVAQERDLFDNQYLKNKKILTDSHIVMLSVVDDKLNESQKRVVTVNNGSTFTYKYSLNEGSKMNKGSQVEDAAKWVNDNINPSNYNVGKYHINISEDGSISFNIKREEVR